MEKSTLTREDYPSVCREIKCKEMGGQGNAKTGKCNQKMGGKNVYEYV